MEVHEDVYVFPLETEYFGNDRTWYPLGVETEHGLILFDVGGPGDEDVLEETLAADGFSFDDLEKIIMTHHDYDHLGCLTEVVEQTNVEVVAHKYATPYVTAETRMIKRPEEPYPGVPVDIQLTGGERFRTKNGEVETIFTPGHAPGHMVFYLKDARLLVAGDLLRSDSEYLSGPKREMTPDLATARESIGKLTELDVDVVACFHGGPIEATAADIRHVYDDLAHEV